MRTGRSGHSSAAAAAIQENASTATAQPPTTIRLMQFLILPDPPLPSAPISYDIRTAKNGSLSATDAVEKPGEWFGITMRIKVYCAVDGLDRAAPRSAGARIL